jgi:hypothetical protein
MEESLGIQIRKAKNVGTVRKGRSGIGTLLNTFFRLPPLKLYTVQYRSLILLQTCQTRNLEKQKNKKQKISPQIPGYAFGPVLKPVRIDRSNNYI